MPTPSLLSAACSASSRSAPRRSPARARGGAHVFGAVGFVLAGDFNQLPPVEDPPLYVARAYHQPGGGRADDVSMVLTRIFRQAGDADYAAFLTRARDGLVAKPDVAYLNARSAEAAGAALRPDADEHTQRTTSLPVPTIAGRRAACADVNQQVMVAAAAPIFISRARDTGGNTARMDADAFGGLPRSVLLQRGAAYVLRRNLWLERGLVNNARCILREVVYESEEDRAAGAPPAYALVYMPSYTGPRAPPGDQPRLVRIPPVEIRRRRARRRRQLPRAAAAAAARRRRAHRPRHARRLAPRRRRLPRRRRAHRGPRLRPPLARRLARRPAPHRPARHLAAAHRQKGRPAGAHPRRCHGSAGGARFPRRETPLFVMRARIDDVRCAAGDRAGDLLDA